MVSSFAFDRAIDLEQARQRGSGLKASVPRLKGLGTVKMAYVESFRQHGSMLRPRIAGGEEEKAPESTLGLVLDFPAKIELTSLFPSLYI